MSMESAIKLIRTDTTLDLSQNGRERYDWTARVRGQGLQDTLTSQYGLWAPLHWVLVMHSTIYLCKWHLFFQRVVFASD